MGPVAFRRPCAGALLGAVTLAFWLLTAGLAHADDATPRQCRGLVIPTDRGFVDAVPRNGLDEVRLACLRGATASQTYHFSVDVVGVAEDRLPEFETVVARTLRDSRGWGGDGAVDLRLSTSDNADFSVLLASPEAVAAANRACSIAFSCRIGDRVMINLRRWDEGAATFDDRGASLAGYRRMVVNHEVGHWLGFGHAECDEPGMRAPVMQQQSKDLQGCEPNSWPLKAERQALAEGPARR